MSPVHLGRVVTVVVPVTDQAQALAFYVDVLGMTAVNDFTYPTGERWLEVSPEEGSSNLCLVAARDDRPAGIETGIVLFSHDLDADLQTLRRDGAAVDDAPMAQGEVVWWSGAPLAGRAGAVPVARPGRQLVPGGRRAVTAVAGRSRLARASRRRPPPRRGRT